jgi:hypothetical protein
MRKKSYSRENETLSIVTPPNATYNGKEIATVITTTAGVFVQSDKSMEISNSKARPKSKTPRKSL